MSTNPLDDEGVIRLFGPLTLETVSPVIESVIVHNLRRERDFLRLWINSPGGEVDQGFALLDILRWSEVPVRTTGLGMVGSMALLVLMAGAKGHRTVLPRTSLLSHRFATMSVGNHADLVAARTQQDLAHRRILDHYQMCTGMEEAAIEGDLLRATDRWLTPEEACRYGMVDRLWISTREAA